MSGMPINVVIQGVIPVPQPGEVIVAKLDADTPSYGVDHIRTKLLKMFPNNRVILLVGDADVSLKPKGTTSGDISVEEAIKFLRGEEGDRLTIFCDNPEAKISDLVAFVEVSGEWTGWHDASFYGTTWTDALKKAGKARRDADFKRKGLVP